MQHARGARGRRVHDRGDRRDHRAGDRPAEERHVPHAGSSPASTSWRTSSQNLHERLPTTTRARVRRCRRSSSRCSRAGWIGEKAGQGFYKRVKSADGESEILTLDPATLEYRPKQPPKLPSLDAAQVDRRHRRADRDAVQRQGQGRPVPARRRWRRRSSTPRESRPRSPTRIDDVDRVMRWGFGWELGPFETADAIGLDA